MDDIRRTQDILHVARHHESKVREAAQAASIPMQRVRLYIHDILGKEDPVSQVIEEAVASGFGVQREPEPSLPWTDIWAAMWIIPAATPASLERSLPGGPSTPKALVIDESVAEPVVVRSTD
jgi:hypothetical protein